MAMSRADTFSSTQHPHLRVYLEPNKPLNECVDSRDGIALLMHFSCLCVLCFFLLHACNFASVIVISRKHTLAHKWIQFFVCVCVVREAFLIRVKMLLHPCTIPIDECWSERMSAPISSLFRMWKIDFQVIVFLVCWDTRMHNATLKWNFR